MTLVKPRFAGLAVGVALAASLLTAAPTADASDKVKFEVGVRRAPRGQKPTRPREEADQRLALHSDGNVHFVRVGTDWRKLDIKAETGEAAALKAFAFETHVPFLRVVMTLSRDRAVDPWRAQVGRIHHGVRYQPNEAGGNGDGTAPQPENRNPLRQVIEHEVANGLITGDHATGLLEGQPADMEETYRHSVGEQLTVDTVGADAFDRPTPTAAGDWMTRTIAVLRDVQLGKGAVEFVVQDGEFDYHIDAELLPD